MVTVTLELLDKNERAWFGERMNELESYREAKANGTLPAPQAEPAPTTTSAPQAEYVDEPAEVIATITPEAVTVHAGAASPSAETMFDALRNFVRKTNYATARALLDKYKVEKITDPMDDSVKLALLAELKA